MIFLFLSVQSADSIATNDFTSLDTSGTLKQEIPLAQTRYDLLISIQSELGQLKGDVGRKMLFTIPVMIMGQSCPHFRLIPSGERWPYIFSLLEYYEANQEQISNLTTLLGTIKSFHDLSRSIIALAAEH